MLMTALLILAIILNYGCPRNLLMIVLAGISANLPMHLLKDSYYLWYMTVILAESIRIFVAYRMNTLASAPVTVVCGLMVVSHLISFMYDGFSMPYKTIMPYLEHVEIVCLILFSSPSLHYLKRKVQCLLKL